MEQVENRVMKFIFSLIVLASFPSYGFDLSLWNRSLLQVSGPKDCPTGDLKGNQQLKLASLGERMFPFTDGALKTEVTNVPGCLETFRTTYNAKKNEFTKNAKIAKCIQPMDDKEYTETLRMNISKKTVKYSYHHKKTKTLERKFVCRYTYR